MDKYLIVSAIYLSKDDVALRTESKKNSRLFEF